MEGIDLDLQGDLAISIHKTAFNAAVVHWSKPAKGCYTSQTYSCYSLAFQAEGVLSLPASVRPSVNLTWPHDNSSQILAEITKFAPNMHPGILLDGNGNSSQWPWLSRSFWPFWLRILGNSACILVQTRDVTRPTYSRLYFLSTKSLCYTIRTEQNRIVFTFHDTGLQGVLTISHPNTRACLSHNSDILWRCVRRMV